MKPNLPHLEAEELARLAEQPEAHHLDSRPIYLPTTDPKEVAMEWDKLKRPQWRGVPKEL